LRCAQHWRTPGDQGTRTTHQHALRALIEVGRIPVQAPQLGSLLVPARGKRRAMLTEQEFSYLSRLVALGHDVCDGMSHVHNHAEHRQLEQVLLRADEELDILRAALRLTKEDTL
jgi:hypothetical protein